MVKILTFDELNSSEIIKRMKEGDIFIYPTDTIYGIGCNALNQKSVDKIRKLKKRGGDKPFSVIAPTKKWIETNLEVENKNYIKKLPGPFTFLLKIKARSIAKKINPGFDIIGLRIPDHPFSNLVKLAKIPFITTSVNLSSKLPIRDTNKIPKSILKHVDFVIDDGYLHRYPSTIIDLTGKMPKIIKRRM
ncbi:threonylcarbamoyl-AMP synthase [archaeon]|jgi:tRNA threonylcarbamoyl adenosine modification protein (Sua5/YciO/YrdC/YwlC family)|nr:threonylcarbamoyl-AMP synthase [archaeon]MBT6824260.1 threonylcarbamoyl-AMP synthase [archaeon]